MRSILCTLLFSLVILGSAAAQNKAAVIKGKVNDSKEQPLPMATVMLLQAADSVLSTFGMTDDKGTFSLPKTSKGKYILQISYLGFQNYQKPIEINGIDETIDVGMVNLEEQSELLSEVVVQGEANPLNIKKTPLNTMRWHSKRSPMRQQKNCSKSSRAWRSMPTAPLKRRERT
ncbi:MAG: carboxypeptidase-like regulatory domain-containing protein [Haliscomenobacter sp.]|nr:carboxypeptidase-like regulatory domain-containing protein [Haliscomenobacter sp.]